MIIFSQPRNGSGDEELVRQLAAQHQMEVQHIPFLYDLPADSPVIEQLRALSEPAYFVIPLAKRAAMRLLEYLRIPFADVIEYAPSDASVSAPPDSAALVQRWYPVIDFQRCLGCLECVNFCLFGVYAIGDGEKPVVASPDSCRDGCPACSRVCPGKAIMFPLYSDKEIAGYEAAADSLDNLVDLVDKI